MRELLQRAIAAIEKLPADAQEATATRLLAEAADEQAWSTAPTRHATHPAGGRVMGCRGPHQSP